MPENPASRIRAAFYQPGDAGEWDRFVSQSANGGLLHSRRFLDYHGARFRDASLVFRDGHTGHLTGVMPIVADPHEGALAASHAGSSFGGLVVERPDPLCTAAMFSLGSGLLQEVGFKSLIYAKHPTLFHRQPDDSDELLLARAGRIVEFHLWSVIRLGNRRIVSERKRLAPGAAEKAGMKIIVTETDEDYAEFYRILVGNLTDRHQRKPLHRFDEIMDIRERLGESARLVVATSAEGERLAATWIWDYGNGVWHSQYICATPLGRRRRAIDALLLRCTALAVEAGQQVYSLGRNSRGDDWNINRGLLTFKKRLGCGLCAQKSFEIELPELQKISDGWVRDHG